jgi:hypothetical protein
MLDVLVLYVQIDVHHNIAVDMNYQNENKNHQRRVIVRSVIQAGMQKRGRHAGRYADKRHAKIKKINPSSHYLTLFVFPIEDEDASPKLVLNDPNNNNNDNSVVMTTTTKYDGTMAALAVVGFFADDVSVIFIITLYTISELKIERQKNAMNQILNPLVGCESAQVWCVL